MLALAPPVIGFCIIPLKSKELIKTTHVKIGFLRCTKSSFGECTSHLAKMRALEKRHGKLSYKTRTLTTWTMLVMHTEHRAIRHMSWRTIDILNVLSIFTEGVVTRWTLWRVLDIKSHLHDSWTLCWTNPLTQGSCINYVNGDMKVRFCRQILYRSTFYLMFVYLERPTTHCYIFFQRQR